MSFLLEQAGGLSITGKSRIMVIFLNFQISIIALLYAMKTILMMMMIMLMMLMIMVMMMILMILLVLMMMMMMMMMMNNVLTRQQDLTPVSVHQRVPCIMGSPEDVLEVKGYYDRCEDVEEINTFNSRAAW